MTLESINHIIDDYRRWIEKCGPAERPELEAHLMFWERERALMVQEKVSPLQTFFP